MFLYNKQPLRLKELFVNGWDLYLHTYHFSWLWAFLNAILFLASDYFTEARTTELIHWKYYPFAINVTILLLLFLLPWSFLRSIIMTHMHYYAIGEKRSFLKALTVTLKRFFPAYVSTVIYQGITILGLALFVVPGIYVTILFFMYLPLCVLENESIYQCLRKSVKLVYGSWWETCLLMLLPIGLMYFIREAMRIYFYNDIVMLALCVFLLSLIIPYSYSILLIQYNNLKIKSKLANISTATSRG